MSASDFRVVEENYISGREYTIWKCDNEYINLYIEIMGELRSVSMVNVL